MNTDTEFDDDFEPQLNFAPSGTRRLCVMRYGHAVVRDWRIPKPTVLVDTRKQPYSLRQLHPNWIGDLKFATLKTGDYSIECMEHLLALERKSMIDAIQSTISRRALFFPHLRRPGRFPLESVADRFTQTILLLDSLFGVKLKGK